MASLFSIHSLMFKMLFKFLLILLVLTKFSQRLSNRYFDEHILHHLIDWFKIYTWLSIHLHIYVAGFLGVRDQCRIIIQKSIKRSMRSGG